jgi:hypothetical protein
MKYIGSWDVTNTQSAFTWWKGGFNSYFQVSLNGSVRSFSLDNSNNRLYFGGSFTTNTSTYPTLMSYNTSSKVLGNLDLGPFGVITTNGNVFAIAYEPINKLVYIGGDFTIVYGGQNINGLTVNRIAVYNINNGSFRSLSTGLNGTVNSIVLAFNSVWVFGSFTATTSGTTLNRITRWDTAYNAFYSISTALNSTVLTSALYYMAGVNNYNMYIGGAFTSTTAGLLINNIAYFGDSGVTLKTLPFGLNNNVNAFAVDTSRNLLYFGGDFTTALSYSTGISSYNRNTNSIGFLNLTSTFPPKV